MVDSMLSKIRFEEEWDEMCPIFRKIDHYKVFEYISSIELWIIVLTLKVSYEVHQRLNSMCEMLWELDNEELLKAD